MHITYTHVSLYKGAVTGFHLVIWRNLQPNIYSTITKLLLTIACISRYLNSVYITMLPFALGQLLLIVK